jgi:hypothetical protein
VHATKGCGGRAAHLGPAQHPLLDLLQLLVSQLGPAAGQVFRQHGVVLGEKVGHAAGA